MSDWKYQEGTTGYKEWWRSWRQEINTPLGSDKVLTAYIERIRVYDDGTAQQMPQESVVISASAITDPGEGADAMAIQEAMTRIIGRRLEAK